MFITGRQKDVIVLSNGKNVYPQELETLINRLSYVKESMVFARNNSKTDTVLIAKIVYDDDEMKKKFPNKKQNEYKDVIWNDIKAINKNLVLYKNIKQIIVTNVEMNKTTTQKIKRYQEINNLQENIDVKSELHKNEPVLPQNETEAKVLKYMQEVLDAKEIDVETDFFEAGGDSLSAIEIQVNLSKENIELNTQEIYDNPSAKKCLIILEEIKNQITQMN